MLLNQLNKPAIIAHRGSSEYAPENTMAAFRLAIEQKADAIELDVMLSADQVPVVIHDAQLGRTAKASGAVGKTNLADLKKLDVGSWFDGRFAAEKIPTLEEVLIEIAPRIPINIELKNLTTPFDQLPELVADMIVALNVTDKVWMSSFNPIALKRFRAVQPTIPIGLLGFPTAERIWYGIQAGLKAEAIHPHRGSISADFINSVHANKQKVFPYTVNDVKQMAQFFEWGIDGIITNDPVLAGTI